MPISCSGSLLKQLFLPPTRILDISDADTLQDLDRYSMGSSGVCGGGIAAAASSSSSTTSNRNALPAFQPLSMAISPTQSLSALGTSALSSFALLSGWSQAAGGDGRLLIAEEARTEHEEGGVEPPWPWQKEQGGHEAGEQAPGFLCYSCLSLTSLPPLPGTEYFYYHCCNILVPPSLFSSHLFPAAELSGTSEGLTT